MESFTPVLGIDFGTSNSKMAWYNPATGIAEPLENSDGEKVTPSVVYFGQDQVLVGKPAIEMLEDEQSWDRVIISVKRSMVKAPIINLPDREVRPIEVAAEIMRKLKRDAETLHFYQEVKHAVITCPATFDVLEREAIKKAGQLAGLSQVEILPEPLAAALAFTRGRERTGFQVGNNVLIYDLGGGTFDLASLTREGKGFRAVLEPQGIKECGGDDFDTLLYNYCDKLAQDRLHRPISLTGERDLHFLYECRKRKENLSTAERRTFSSLLSPGAVSFKFELDRSTFEDLIRAKVVQTVQKTKGMFEQSSARGYEIDTFILVGGASQVPLIKRLLDESLPTKALEWMHRDVAVALGAAYHAHNTWNGNTGELQEGDKYKGEAKKFWKDTAQGQTGSGFSTIILESESKSANFSLAHTLTGHSGPIRAVAISPNGQLIASGSEDHMVMLWNLDNGQLVRVFGLEGPAGSINALSFSPNGQLLIAGSSNGTIKSWNLYTGKPFYTFNGQAGITSLAVSPDGRLLVGGGFDAKIMFWNLYSAMPLPPLSGHNKVIWSVAFSPDGQLLASAGVDRTVKLWNLRNASLVHTFTGHLGSIQSVVFSPNGQLLGSGGEDQEIKFWNLRTGALLRPLAGHTGTVSSLAFTADGGCLLSGSLDGTIRLWNLRTGSQMRTFAGHAGGVLSIAISPDGRAFISGSIDNTVKIWKSLY